MVDANVLFSAIIKDSQTRKILSSEKLSFLAPEYLLEEMAEHKSEIEQKSGLPAQQIDRLLRGFFEMIEVVESARFKEFLKKALSISPDPEDAPYLALCLSENIPLWSNDARLKKQKEIPVYSTRELLNLME